MIDEDHTEWREFDDREIMATALSDMVADQLAHALKERERALLAVPGGTTPGSFLTDLGEAEIPWSRITILPTDERFVPPGHERSNEALFRRTLLTGPAAAAEYLSFAAAALDQITMAQALSDRLAPLLPVDVCVLGMGTDGHIASIFPGADTTLALMDPEQVAAVLPATQTETGERRLSLTAVTIAQARHRHLLIHGPEKLALAETACHEACPLPLPVQMLFQPGVPTTVWHAP